MKRTQCIGCGSNKLIKVTIETETRVSGLCKECYTIPEQRFPKTEQHMSALTRAILGL